MKMLFGQRNGVRTADGLRYWIEGRYGRVSGKRLFTSVVFWTHPAYRDGYYNEVLFNKPRPSAKEIEAVLISARFSLLQPGMRVCIEQGSIVRVNQVNSDSTIVGIVEEGLVDGKEYVIPATTITRILVEVL